MTNNFMITKIQNLNVQGQLTRPATINLEDFIDFFIYRLIMLYNFIG